jgi:predicted nucleotidyltransferase component of viral defense system
LNTPLNAELIAEIAAELGVQASFVEKDWHAMRLIAVLADVVPSSTDTRLVFGGGTSLSKGYGLIKRFSEDLDFKVAQPASGLSRPDRRAYRETILQAIRTADEDWMLNEEATIVRDASNFFQCQIAYHQNFSPSFALRPHIKLEVTFEIPALIFEERPLCSFIAQAQGQPAEVPLMACVSPVETAADKLCALSWRLAGRQRGSSDDDPTLVRHLHDLAALEPMVLAYTDFPAFAHPLLLRDASRNKNPDLADLTPLERLTLLVEKLNNDPLYAEEYERFVLGMSYAADDERPTFEAAVAAIERIVTLL